MQVLARHYQTGQAVRVTVENGVYSSLESSPMDSPELPWVAPGLIDVQINGGGGIDFNRPGMDEAAWIKATDNLYKHGCTGFLIALITNLRQTYRAILEGLEPLRRARTRNCLGYHFEGPFLNSEPGYHGAHCVEWMTPPRVELFGEWQELTEMNVRLVTFAPEVDFAAGMEFIRYLEKQKILISAGHSALMGEQRELDGPLCRKV